MLRSIPACAGEPAPRIHALFEPRVYPRVCGGTAMNGSPCDHATGLSPRVRGNHQLAKRAGRELGSIPACAGEPP